jgi:uncharacterized protein with PIN domain
MLVCGSCSSRDFEWSRDVNGNKVARCLKCGTCIVIRKPKKIEKEGDLCRLCNTPVVLRQSPFKKSKLKKAYYYTAYYYCPKCEQRYYDEKFKVYTGTLAPLPVIKENNLKLF